MKNNYMDRAWDVLFTMRLSGSDIDTWYGKIYEYAVASNINLIDFYDHILQTKTIPTSLRIKLIDVIASLKGFYGNK